MFYCGKRSTNIPIEQDEYYGSGDIISRILKKSSSEEIKERFTKIILEVNDTFDQNVEGEKYWGDEVFHASTNPLFYNISDCGYGGNLISGLSDEEKKKVYFKIGLGNKGKYHTEESKKKISIGGMGLKRSNETKENISKSKMGEKNPFYGKTHSKEVLQKIKEYSTGRNNPRATFVKVVDKNNNELFRGIRKEVEEWCENKGICSIGSIKILLYKNLPFHPNYKTKRFLNSKQYDGIRFQYV